MTVNTAYNPFNQPLDINGNVLSGAKWYFYENGNTTLKDIYQDQAKTSTHANPVIADSQGRFPEIWLDGVYSIRIAKEDDTWITNTQMDNYNAGFNAVDQDASSGSGLSGFEYDASNSSGLSFKVNDGIVGGLGSSSTVSTAALTLSASATNYIYLQEWDNTVAASTTAGSINTVPLYEVTTDSSSVTLITDRRADQVKSGLPKDYIDGLILSDGSDADHDITVALGQCRDSTNALDIDLTSAITKQIDASWAEGNNLGGLFTGSVAANTTYYVYAITKGDGSADVGYDISSTAPTTPTDWDYFRLVGSVETDSSGNIITDSTASTSEVGIADIARNVRPKELISELDAATLTNIDFTGLSGYDEYELQIEALGHGSAAGQELRLQIGSGGFDTGASDYRYTYINNELATTATAQDLCYELEPSTEYLGSASLGSERRCFATINFLGMHNASIATYIKSTQLLVNSAFEFFGNRTMQGVRQSNAAQDQIRLTTSGGVAFTIGTVRLYGIRS